MDIHGASSEKHMCMVRSGIWKIGQESVRTVCPCFRLRSVAPTVAEKADERNRIKEQEDKQSDEELNKAEMRSCRAGKIIKTFLSLSLCIIKNSGISESYIYN